MSDQNLKTGDVVMLKSGGPIMTVGFIGKTDVTCTWFVGQEVREATFKVDQLVLADPETGMAVRGASV